MPKTKAFRLPREEKKRLENITKKGLHSIWTIKRAHILLKTDLGWDREKVAQYVELSEKTVKRRLDRYSEGGIEEALYDDARTGQPKKLNAKAEAFLIATACSDAPEGYDHWTLELLQKKMIKEKKVKSIARFTIGRYLKNRDIKPWLEKNVVCSGDNDRI